MFVKEDAEPSRKKPRKQKKSKTFAAENETINQQAYMYYPQQLVAMMPIQIGVPANHVQASSNAVADEEDDSELPPPPAAFYQSVQYPHGTYSAPYASHQNRNPGI
jgi:hypothetical protein